MTPQQQLASARAARLYPRLATLLADVGAYFGVSLGAMFAAGRQRRVARPRQIAMWVARQTGASYPEIGAAFGRDHTTVLHGCRVIDRMMAADPAFAALVQRVRGEVAP